MIRRQDGFPGRFCVNCGIDDRAASILQRSASGGVDLAIAETLIWLLSLAVLAVTLLPLFKTHHWWVRMWEFPRPQILIVALGLAILALVFMPGQSLPVLLILGGCAACQAREIFPFTPLARREIELTAAPDRPHIRFLAVNVEMENEDFDALIALIDEEDPDVLFLMETDRKWADAMGGVLSRYGTVLSHPLDNYYGLIFATRLDARSVDTLFLSEDDTPTLLADLRAPDGADFHFIGMHPRPPVPGNTTKERDAQIKMAATLAKGADVPVISMGDFNDVAWSWTSHRFKRYGNFRDPRVGRGMLPSFDARRMLLRFPIDQLYVNDGIDLVSFGRKRSIGSDHFPMAAVIAVRSPRTEKPS